MPPVFMRYWITAIIIIILDQATKWMVRSVEIFREGVNIIDGFFQLKYVENHGAAFSSLWGERYLLLCIGIVVLVILFAYIYKERKRLSSLNVLALTMIITGGIGNMIDRFLFGYVTDMFSFSFFSPVFNVADISITLGAGLYILSILVFGRSRN